MDNLKNIVVKKDDMLIVTISDDSVGRDAIDALKKNLLAMRPDLEGRLVILQGPVQLGLIKGEEDDDRRSMKGVC